MEPLAEDGDAIELVKEELNIFATYNMDMIDGDEVMDEVMDEIAVSILQKLDAHLLLRK
jgi:hypothetical protein